jgi:hypothetical protein
MWLNIHPAKQKWGIFWAEMVLGDAAQFATLLYHMGY